MTDDARSTDQNRRPILQFLPGMMPGRPHRLDSFTEREVAAMRATDEAGTGWWPAALMDRAIDAPTPKSRRRAGQRLRQRLLGMGWIVHNERAGVSRRYRWAALTGEH